MQKNGPVADSLLSGLFYAFEVSPQLQRGGQIAVLNACGQEPSAWTAASWDASIHRHAPHMQKELQGRYDVVCIRATRQRAETRGLVAQAALHNLKIDSEACIVITQHNDHGAKTLEDDLKTVFTDISVISKGKKRTIICVGHNFKADILAQWEAEAAPRLIAATGFWSQPGLFSYDRIDVGSQLLASCLPQTLTGQGADIGCGYGFLARTIMSVAGVKKLTAVDVDARAVAACARNVPDARLETVWADATQLHPQLNGLDWVVTNPPFHTQQDESQALGQAICSAALSMLKPRGKLWLVANRHLPYESYLQSKARSMTCVSAAHGFKIIHCIKA